MTDPLEACLQELNEAVSHTNLIGSQANNLMDHLRAQALQKNVDRLRHKYNALVIAYAERTD